MIALWIKDAEGKQSLLSEGLLKILEDTRDAASEVIESEDEESDDDEDTEEEEEDEDDDDESSDGSMGSNLDSDLLWMGDSMTAKVMTIWLKRKENLCHDYSLVGFLLSPNPTIMEAAEKHTADHKAAVARLIEKLFVDPLLVGQARVAKRAMLINTFWLEYSDFTLRLGRFRSEDMWFIAAMPDQAAHTWHKTYSVGCTVILGRLGCIVCSKILGIGTAERNWKQIKAVKTGQRAALGAEKCKKQALIYGRYQHQRAKVKYARLSSAGKLWNDEDFNGCKMDVHCKEIIDSLETSNDQEGDDVRIFRAWVEEWEKRKIGPQGDVIFKARLVRKYGGLK